MNLYTKLQKLIEKYRCERCLGSGTLNDAEPGDMYFNTIACPVCKGTGLSKTLQQIQALVGRLSC